MGARLLVLLLALEVLGCGSYFTTVGHDAASGALSAVTSDDAQKKLASLAGAATKSARDEVLGATTDAQLQKLVLDTGTATRAQLNDMIAGLITEVFQAKIRETVRMALDEAFGKTTLKEAAALREELVGAPLQHDLDSLIDSATPHLTKAVQQAVQTALQTSVTPLKTDVSQEEAKWRPIALAFAIGCGLLCLCLVFAAYILRGHRQVIESLTRSRGGRES